MQALHAITAIAHSGIRAAEGRTAAAVAGHSAAASIRSQGMERGDESPPFANHETAVKGTCRLVDLLGSSACQRMIDRLDAAEKVLDSGGQH